VTAHGPAAAAGWAIDHVVGEPPTALHPVAWFGTAMTRLESHTYRDASAAGAIHLAIGVGGAWFLGRLATRLLGAPIATALATGVSVAGRMLLDEGTAIIDAVERGDLDDARRRLPTLVGRDPSLLYEDEVLRAVVESVAENSVDAVIAPLLWATAGGAPAVLAHRASNTLDAMVGHPNQRYQRFGRAAARFDDALNWLPARLAAAGVAVLVPSRRRAIWQCVRHDARAHPSPNAGVIEAAVAAAVGVRVGGMNRYGDHIEDRGILGSDDPPSVAEARRAVALVRRLGGLAALAALVTAWPSTTSWTAGPTPWTVIEDPPRGRCGRGLRRRGR